MIRNFVFVVLLSFAAFQMLLAADGPKRQVTVELNPGCTVPECKLDVYDEQNDGNSTFFNLLYVKATGSADILHILYSSIDSFTVMFYKTDLNGVLKVNWDMIVSQHYANSITFTTNPTEVFGYSFPTVYEFNDDQGTADMDKIPNNASYWILHKTADEMWKPFTMDKSGKSIGSFESFNPTKNGSFKFNIRYPGQDKRDDDLPHMLLNSDSSSFDFIVDSLNCTFKDAKIALNVVFLSSLNSVDFSYEKTLDDEYTPGTFKLWNVQMKDASSNVQNFFQWKPIFYFYAPLSLENSTITKQYKVVQSEVTPVGIGRSYFSDTTLYYAMNVSYGLEGNEKDGYYYPQTSYSAWSFSLGRGDAPKEKMSSIVTFVIFIGFGLPALVIVVGFVVMIYKKVKKSRQDSSFSSL